MPPYPASVAVSDIRKHIHTNAMPFSKYARLRNFVVVTRRHPVRPCVCFLANDKREKWVANIGIGYTHTDHKAFAINRLQVDIKHICTIKDGGKVYNSIRIALDSTRMTTLKDRVVRALPF